MPARDLKGVPISPLTGVLDARSSPDQMPANSLRLRQNFETLGQGKLKRGTGWSKLLSEANYNNADFHDQLLTFTPGVPRQPVTLLFEAESTRKTRSLIVGTQGKLAELNQRSGNYRILGSGLGGDQSVSAAAPRVRAAQVGDYLAFTNDFDKPKYHLLESPGDEPPALIQEFAELATIGLTRAAVVWAWHDLLFFADVEMDGDRFANRMVWSGFKDPTSFDPAKLNSITGSKDLYTHERILGALPFQNVLLIYTTHGIWEMYVVGGEQTFSFLCRYDGRNNQGAAVLKYPNTLVATPDEHLYMAEDGIYMFSPFIGEPKRPEWLHRSTPLIYDGLDSENCMVHNAVFSRNTLLLSVAKAGTAGAMPSLTLRINRSYQTVDVVDHGFTAFCNYRPYDVPNIRDFIIDNRICDAQGLTDAGFGWTKEGLPRPVPSGTAPFEPQSFYTKQTQVIDGATTEDWNKAEADADSLCALLGNQRLDDFCRKCEGVSILVGASASDWCLKELGSVFYRERCANPTGVGASSSIGYVSSAGSYLLEGYSSILRFSPMAIPRASVGQPYVELTTIILEAIAKVQVPASQVKLRVGISGQIADPNVEDGRITWFEHSLKDLKLETALNTAQRMVKNIQPSMFVGWSVFRVGRVLYVELSISGTGGDSEWTNVVAEVRAKEASNY